MIPAASIAPCGPQDNLFRHVNGTWLTRTGIPSEKACYGAFDNLQPPFFNLEAEDAVNYGGIGAVIGHEMGHGFDDQGRSYDSTGALRDWWTTKDAAEYQKRAKVLVEQFNEFEPLRRTCCRSKARPPVINGFPPTNGSIWDGRSRGAA